MVYCGAIHLIGGESQARGENLSEVLRLSPDRSWQRAPDMPAPRSFARAVLVGDAVFVVGGSSTPQASHAAAGTAMVARYRAPCE